jgi:two-component system phosphate regulon sensor histidine kinase PhoR
MNWVAAATRIVALTALAALLGWYYGYPLEAVVLTLGGLVGFWLYQLQRVQTWLQDPQQPPPDIYGIWGDLLAQIYLHQRNNRDIQLRLQDSVKYLQDSFSSMRDGVVMVDEQGAIKWCNRAVQPLLGLRYPDDTGQTLTNLVRAPEFNAYFLEGEYGAPLQYCSNGDTRSHLQMEISRFGESERLLFVRDISAAVRMEEIRRDFVANVSHELRTPLTVITGYLGTFLTDTESFSPSYTRALRQMEQQAGRMENLLKDLLLLSRIESEEREDKRELVDVCGLLQELRDELAGTNPQRALVLELNTDRRIHGDYRELYSAVSNLVNNAIKYSPEDCPVAVTWQEQGTGLQLQVRDFGLGIESIHIPRLTERFYRVDDSRSSATGGTGLGLAIVKHVAAAHHARLLIESKPGEGSTFSLVFPPGE